MIADLTMIATLPVDETAVQQAISEDTLPGEARAQQPEPPHPVPGMPKSPEQPVVPPDDPHRKDIEREPSIDPPPTDPPVQAPSEKPGITEPPRPRA
ncbi:MAG TPA: hypothetical protein VEA16_06550 [Vicinamibacterales bacterium]|nr:hypothetical protein [Vicinamibacterales bacterium]